MLDAELSAEQLWGPPDWASLGLVLCLAGALLLAHGTLARDPRSLVEERFGRPRGEGATIRAGLGSLRGALFHRVQTMIGFAFLLAGFAAQLYGRAAPRAPDEAGSSALWTGGVVLAAALLELGAWWWSLVTVRRHLRAWFLEHPPDFDRDPALAREVGDLFGVDSRADEAVQSFAERLRRELGISPPRPQSRGAGVPPPSEESADLGDGISRA